VQCRSYSGKSANSWRGGSSPAIPCSFSTSTGVYTPAPYRLGTIGCFSLGLRSTVPCAGKRTQSFIHHLWVPTPMKRVIYYAPHGVCVQLTLYLYSPQVTLLDRLPWQPRLLPVHSPFAYEFWGLIELEPARRRFVPRFLLSPGRSSFVITVGQLDMFD